jgi:hypothetical protein
VLGNQTETILSGDGLVVELTIPEVTFVTHFFVDVSRGVLNLTAEVSAPDIDSAPKGPGTHLAQHTYSQGV